MDVFKMKNFEKILSVFGVVSAVIAGSVYIGTMNGRLSSIESTVSTINIPVLKRDLQESTNQAKTDIIQLSRSISKGSLGNVEYSVLNEEKFRELNGKEWVLMDGRNIAKSKLCKFSGLCDVPDARGVFVRGMNEKRQGKLGDPDGDRVVGEYQQDSFKSHHHQYVNSGVWGRSWRGSSEGPKTAYEQAGNTNNTGGTETRPRNIALYTYIKIN